MYYFHFVRCSLDSVGLDITFALLVTRAEFDWSLYYFRFVLCSQDSVGLYIIFALFVARINR